MARRSPVGASPNSALSRNECPPSVLTQLLPSALSRVDSTATLPLRSVASASACITESRPAANHTSFAPIARDDASARSIADNSNLIAGVVPMEPAKVHKVSSTSTTIGAATSPIVPILLSASSSTRKSAFVSPARGPSVPTRTIYNQDADPLLSKDGIYAAGKANATDLHRRHLPDKTVNMVKQEEEEPILLLTRQEEEESSAGDDNIPLYTVTLRKKQHMKAVKTQKGKKKAATIKVKQEALDEAMKAKVQSEQAIKVAGRKPKRPAQDAQPQGRYSFHVKLWLSILRQRLLLFARYAVRPNGNST
ncbi:uncharacterized protein LAESUDRAFT_211105 [Laetiporus sulphureus 93-53]|uniref:Uncharacterized protein n=1 Tax=Laetiporus sulphureus 93-53 TaxID=1314785 RepID=A0A165DVD6_9APHY|nr:uncharacterized protein LAESUDRAFT_211105 [Laetiporus sulphureus 93-53]KZT05702.1 hypothetical protein LAESUDRAFT_211105 [Laetiporus sulphureus 93-53]